MRSWHKMCGVVVRVDTIPSRHKSTEEDQIPPVAEHMFPVLQRGAWPKELAIYFQLQSKESLINGAAREIDGSAVSHFSDDEVIPSSFW